MNEYPNVWDYELSCHEYFEESYKQPLQDSWDLDDEYHRDSTDFQQLAYQHYA